MRRYRLGSSPVESGRSPLQRKQGPRRQQDVGPSVAPRGDRPICRAISCCLPQTHQKAGHGQSRRQRQGRLHGPRRRPLDEDGRPGRGARWSGRGRSRRRAAAVRRPERRLHGHSAHDRRVGRGRRQRPRDVQAQLRDRPRPYARGRGQQHRRPGIGPGSPVQRESGRHRHPARREVPGRRSPRTDPDRARQLGHGPDGGRPAALHQRCRRWSPTSSTRESSPPVLSSTPSPAWTRSRSPTRSTPRFRA